MAVEEVMKKWKWQESALGNSLFRIYLLRPLMQESTTYVWLDYSSIPQRRRKKGELCASAKPERGTVRRRRLRSTL